MRETEACSCVSHWLFKLFCRNIFILQTSLSEPSDVKAPAGIGEEKQIRYVPAGAGKEGLLHVEGTAKVMDSLQK